MSVPIIPVIIAGVAIGYTIIRMVFDDSRSTESDSCPKKNESAREKDFKILTEVARKIGTWLRSKLPPSEPIKISEMMYVQAIGYFVENRPLDSRVVKGAMLLQKHSNGRLLIQVFLDENNKVISGRKLVVESLDDELQQAFGDKDLIIVE